LVVPKDSQVTRPSQLENKTVAVNALSSIVHVTAAKAIKDDGGDPSKVTFVAMPFPDMMTALAQGRVDAASVVEPFVTISTEAGANPIAKPYTQSFTPGGSFALFFASEAYAKQHPEVIEKFSQALDKGSRTASEHPEKVSAVLVKYGKVDPGVAGKIRQPGYGGSVGPAALTQAAGVMQDLGFLPGPVDAAKVIWKKP
jgi:NitT/TauT family transport system substrate-binding protein